MVNSFPKTLPFLLLLIPRYIHRAMHAPVQVFHRQGHRAEHLLLLRFLHRLTHTRRRLLRKQNRRICTDRSTFFLINKPDAASKALTLRTNKTFCFMFLIYKELTT